MFRIVLLPHRVHIPNAVSARQRVRDPFNPGPMRQWDVLQRREHGGGPMPCRSNVSGRRISPDPVLTRLHMPRRLVRPGHLSARQQLCHTRRQDRVHPRVFLCGGHDRAGGLSSRIRVCQPIVADPVRGGIRVPGRISYPDDVSRGKQMPGRIGCPNSMRRSLLLSRRLLRPDRAVRPRERVPNTRDPGGLQLR